MPSSHVSHQRSRLAASTACLLLLMIVLFWFSLSAAFRMHPTLYYFLWKPIPSLLEWRVVRSGGNAVYFLQITYRSARPPEPFGPSRAL